MNLEIRILKESFGVLILASILSALGGIGLEFVQEKIFVIIPLLILFPALNGMVGNFGTIFASRYTTLLHEKKLGKKKLMNKALRNHFITLIVIAIISGVYVATLSSAVALFKNFEFNPILYLKIVAVTVISAAFLVAIIAIIVVLAGRHFVKEKEDPDNLLIPITTSIADLGSMLIFSLLIVLFF